jgi:hypothetical protein
VPFDHEGPLEQLDDAECRQLLTAGQVGRLGFTDGAMPAIVPVAYAVHEGSVFIPASRGDSLMTAMRGAVVALEVDSYRDEFGPGWSVTVVGPSRVIRDPVTVAQIDALGLFAQASAASGGYITVQAILLRGRRIRGPLLPVDHGPGADREFSRY